MNDTSIYTAVVSRNLREFTDWANKNNAAKVSSPGLNVVEIGRKRYVFIQANNTLSIKGRTFVGVEYIDNAASQSFKEMLSTRVR